MRPPRTWIAPALVLAALLVGASCGDEGGDTVSVPGHPNATKSTASVRADRRLFDGAPPVIPHEDFGAACLSCHEHGTVVPEIGYAPVAPHEGMERPGAMSRCRMCHVFAETDETFADNTFVGLAQDLRRGQRLNDLAPPVIPHQVLLRENCQACHTGPGAREEIRCSHPERVRCQQCHVAKRADDTFQR